MTTPKIFGIAGWKNSGKTGLAVRLLMELTRRGYRVSTVKHAHHDFDIDKVGADEYLLAARRRLDRFSVAATPGPRHGLRHHHESRKPHGHRPYYGGR